MERAKLSGCLFYAPTVKNRLLRIGKLILGTLLVAVGIAGLFLPFLQGLLMIALGLSLLSSESKWVRRKISALAKRYPRQTARFAALKSKLASRWKKRPA